MIYKQMSSLMLGRIKVGKIVKKATVMILLGLQ